MNYAGGSCAQLTAVQEFMSGTTSRNRVAQTSAIRQYMFAMIAHNLLRIVSLMDDPEHPKMAKRIRRKFINFPAKFMERSKQLWLMVPEIFYKGVILFIEAWQLPEKISAHMASTA